MVSRRNTIFSLTSAIGLGFLVLGSGASAQERRWDNPADRYADAHEAYSGATCPIAADSIRHFVYFARDRQRIRNHPLLSHDRFVGAQIMYPWRALEPRKGVYNFSVIRKDLEYLKRHDKRLFIQLQDTSFSKKYKPVPQYLLSDEYDGGVLAQEENGILQGWGAKRWNPNVQERLSALFTALGEEFDGDIEGINLQESAIFASAEADSSFTPSGYAAALRTNMAALKAAFPTSVTMQYANFMPGEWLPWEDEGYLRSLYEAGEKLGVGLGAPDLMVTRKAQLNHALAMMHEGTFTVPLGIAVQDGNYVGKTGADFVGDPEGEKKVQRVRPNLVPKLHAFAKDFLGVDYMFWVDQEPYFSEDVLTCL